MEEIKNADKAILDAIAEIKKENNALREETKKIESLKNEIKELQGKLTEKETVIRHLESSGLDPRFVKEIPVLAPRMGFSANFLEQLLEENRGEYIKEIMKKYTNIMSEQMVALQDKQLDLNGESLIEKLKDVVTFFEKIENIDEIKKEEIAEYKEMRKTLLSTFQQLMEWQIVVAIIQTTNSTTTGLMFHYALKVFEEESRKKIEKLKKESSSEKFFTKLQEIPTTIELEEREEPKREEEPKEEEKEPISTETKNSVKKKGGILDSLKKLKEI